MVSNYYCWISCDLDLQKQPSRGVLIKNVLKICSKFTEEHPCRSTISLKFQSNCIEITLRHECSPVNLLHIFKTRFPRSTSGGLLLDLMPPLKVGSAKFLFDLDEMSFGFKHLNFLLSIVCVD